MLLNCTQWESNTMNIRNFQKYNRVDPNQMTSEGGPEQSTIKKRLRENGMFPSDTKNFYPDKIVNEDSIRRVMKRIEQSNKSKVPHPLMDLQVVPELKTINGRDFIRLSIQFIQDNDPNFHAARVWIKGYLTDNALADPTLPLGAEETIPYESRAQIQRSPSSIVLEKTDEEVIIGVEAVNSDGVGSGLDSMPTQALTLDGV